jgi:hypothetical protein
MKTTTILTIIAIVAAIGMVTSSISNSIVFADKGGIPNPHAGDNPTKHCTDNPTPHCPPIVGTPQ